EPNSVSHRRYTRDELRIIPRAPNCLRLGTPRWHTPPESTLTPPELPAELPSSFLEIQETGKRQSQNRKLRQAKLARWISRAFSTAKTAPHKHRTQLEGSGRRIPYIR